MIRGGCWTWTSFELANWENKKGLKDHDHGRGSAVFNLMAIVLIFKNKYIIQKT